MNVISSMLCVLAFGLSLWMAQVSCHKCRQAVPHESDSWCLACSATEALSQELRNIWGSPGSRLVATDVVVSALRQVRALRRLGVGAGSAAASANPLGHLAPAEPAEPPKRAETGQATVGLPAGSAVKEEESEEGEESEEESESEEKATVGASAKSKADSSAPLPRRRSNRGEKEAEEESSKKRREKEDKDKKSRTRSRKRRRESSRKEEDRSRTDKGDQGREERSHRSSGWKRPGSTVEQPHHKEGQSGRRRAHRGGSRHQRLYRAQEDPYKRFHHQRPEGYWDQTFTSFR